MYPLPLSDSPPSANETVAKFRLQVRHLSLRELDTEGFLDWNRDENVVKKGIRFDEKWDEIRQSDTPDR
jgi:hypothetical protein